MDRAEGPVHSPMAVLDVNTHSTTQLKLPRTCRPDHRVQRSQVTVWYSKRVHQTMLVCLQSGTQVMRTRHACDCILLAYDQQTNPEFVHDSRHTSCNSK